MVHAGMPVEFRAGEHNAIAEAANAWRESRHGGGAGRVPDGRRQGAIVPVRNNTGADCGRLAILGIDAPVFAPTDVAAFKRQVAVKGDTPDEDLHVGRFVVLQEPLASGKIGNGMVAGVTPVRVNIVAEGLDRFADICDQVSTYLTSGASGSAMILCREKQGQSPPTTGEQWAYVLLGTPNWFNSDGDEFEVWQLQDIGGGVLRPRWDFVRMHS